jgi:glycosyltransferase involved in cell wall biosynthesis
MYIEKSGKRKRTLRKIDSMNDLISVIIPIYKVEEYLDECVTSVVNQTYSDLEIILVDDGSPDNCPQMCDEWAGKDNRIKVIHKVNGGLSDARNAGIEIATGEYIAFVDSDDFIKPDMIEKLRAALAKADADIAACGILTCEGETQTAWGCRDLVGTPEQIYELLYNDTAYPVAAWNKLYRKSCWETLRFPVGKTCEDAFTTYQLIHNARRIVMIPEALYCYRIRPGSIMTSSFSLKKMDAEEAWCCNYTFMEQFHPQFRKSAFDFYLQKVNELSHMMDEEDKKNFAAQYRFLRNILKRNFWYVIFCSKISLKQRIKLALDILKQ